MNIGLQTQRSFVYCVQRSHYEPSNFLLWR